MGPHAPPSPIARSRPPTSWFGRPTRRRRHVNRSHSDECWQTSSSRAEQAAGSRGGSAEIVAFALRAGLRARRSPRTRTETLRLAGRHSTPAWRGRFVRNPTSTRADWSDESCIAGGGTGAPDRHCGPMQGEDGPPQHLRRSGGAGASADPHPVLARRTSLASCARRSRAGRGRWTDAAHDRLV